MRVVPDVSFTFRTTLRKFGTFSHNTASHHRRFKSYKHTHKRARAVYKYNASNVGLRPWGRSHEQPQISAHCKGVVQPLTGSIYEPIESWSTGVSQFASDGLLADTGAQDLFSVASLTIAITFVAERFLWREDESLLWPCVGLSQLHIYIFTVLGQ